MSGRYAEELVDAGFAVEVADAPLLHDGLNVADLAHLLVLVERGVVPSRAVPGLVAVLTDADRTPAAEFGYDPRHGEVYNCREKRFAAAIGRDAGWLHAGRPRREAVRIALRLRVRRDLCDLIEAAAAFALAGARTAAAHAETLMVDQTYLQHAQPSTFGHYLLGMVHPALREIERLTADLDGVDRSPAGAGGVNGSPLTGDRAHIAELLGFAEVIEHTRDAMWASDGYTALVGHAAGLATTLDRLAEDLEIWSSAEFGWVHLALEHTRTSILMPQKRNPYALTMVRGEAGVLIGRATGMLALAKSPSARSDNMIFSYGEVPRSVDLATRATRLMAGVVAELEVDAAAMEAALRGGFSQAADLAEHLMVTAGLDYRSAYDVVGIAVRRAAGAGLTGADLTREDLESAAAEAGLELTATLGDLAEVLDPARIVRSRDSRGGAAPDEVRRMAAACCSVAEKARDAVRARRAGFDTAEAELRRRVAALG
ncbi:argininosuccinate lyase [Actinomycetospora endophytica]|uniref:argininosuccinate lyase n=1 Tax=Actinomycetospora endophytica TaxID=2291215 RepID=A0ABS8P779_9PSEU|nr:lyase family protein [Actinomycetospora endophytica]MCD2192909.1 argininosuccinate lyase [Actinomycetospora endophytica]